MQILLSSNKGIIKNYIKENSKIGFISTASEIYQDRWYMEKDREDLVNMNYNVVDIDITNEERNKIIKEFDLVDAIFVAGGNCFYLLQQLKTKNVINELINFSNKKIYIGSSAGACIACPSIQYAAKLDDIKEAPLLKDYVAMNLIDAYILPHYESKDKYTKIADNIIDENKNLKFIKLTNDQAIIVNNRDNYEIVKTN